MSRLVSAIALLLGLLPSATAMARGHSDDADCEESSPGSGVPGASIDLEDLGDLHNAGLDYVLERTDVDGGGMRAVLDLRVGMVDYMCQELAGASSHGRGSTRNCEEGYAHRLLELSRSGLPVLGTFSATLDPDSVEASTLAELDDMVDQLSAGRIDLDTFGDQLSALAEAAEEADPDRDAAEIVTIALSLGGSSARYWHAVERDPDSRWHSLAELGSGGPDGDRLNWGDVIKTDVEAGLGSWASGNSQNQILSDAIIASAEVVPWGS